MSLDQSRQEIPTAPDYDEIVAFIQANYIDSINNGDAAALRRFFHEDASYFFVEQDGTSTQQGPCDDALVREWIAEPDDPYDWEWTVIWVRQAGDLASVMLEMHSRAEPDERWVDLHALLRIDGQWHDMNKTAVHADLADWAGR